MLNPVKKHFFSITIVILGVFIIITFLHLFSQRIDTIIENETQAYLEEIRDNAIFLLNTEIEKFSANLEAEARTLSLLGPMSDQEILNEIQSFDKDKSMSRCHVFATDGKVYSSLNDWVKQYDTQPYEYVFKEQRGLSISQPRLSSSLHRMIIDISTPLYIDGTYKGVLVGSYDINQFETLLANNFLKGDCSINVTTSTGELVSSSASTAAPQSLKDNIFDFYQQKDLLFTKGTAKSIIQNFANNKPGYVTYRLDDINRYVSYGPAGINGWFIGAVCTDKTLDQKAQFIRDTAFHLVAAIFITMLLITVVILVFTAREQTAVQSFLKRLADTDSLTSLCTRSCTERQIHALLANYPDSRFAFCMIDIDGFKNINDNLGHIRGDQVLADFSASLCSIFSAEDVIGRMGGDEFIVFVKDYDKAELELNIQQLRHTSRATLVHPEDPQTQVAISASIGISLFPEDGSEFDQLYKCADTALYRSKNNGRDRCTFFSS